jgi:hypothetical protein
MVREKPSSKEPPVLLKTLSLYALIGFQGRGFEDGVN